MASRKYVKGKRVEWHGTAADFALATGSQYVPGDFFVVAETGAVYRRTLSDWERADAKIKPDGSIQIGSDLPPGNQRIREINALTAAQTLDWSALPNGISAVTIYVVQEVATLDGTSTPLPEVAVCVIDPPNATIRDAWLTAADKLTTDSERLPILANEEPLVLIFRDSLGELVGVDYIGIKLDLGADAVRVFAVGVEAQA